MVKKTKRVTYAPTEFTWKILEKTAQETGLPTKSAVIAYIITQYGKGK